MSETTNAAKFRELLLADLNSLKAERTTNEEKKKVEVISGLKLEKEIIGEHGKAMNKINEIINSLKGETISEEHVQMITKYLAYLKGQAGSVNQIIKMEEETKELENSF